MPSIGRAPTPCSDWSLGELAGHVVGAAEAFATVLAGGSTPALARIDGERATGDAVRDAAAGVVALWRDPAVTAREYDDRQLERRRTQWYLEDGRTPRVR